MQLKEGDRIYCYRRFYEPIDKDNFANSVIDIVGDRLEDIGDWFEDILDIDLDEKKFKMNNLWNLFKQGIFYSLGSPLILISVLLVLSFIWWSYDKDIIFKKGEYYNIVGVSALNGYYINNVIFKKRFFSSKKSNIVSYLFNDRYEFHYHFLTEKQLRKRKLKKLKI